MVLKIPKKLIASKVEKGYRWAQKNHSKKSKDHLTGREGVFWMRQNRKTLGTKDAQLRFLRSCYVQGSPYYRQQKSERNRFYLWDAGKLRFWRDCL